MATKNITIKTASGLEVKINPNVIDDMELIDDIMDLYAGRNADIKGVVNRLIGEAQRVKLYEHCRKNGVVSATKVMREVEDIFVKATNRVTMLKKSQASQ